MTHANTVTDAAYHTVHDYPGGAPALAPRIGIASPRVLDNKVNPCQGHHKLTLREAEDLIAFTGDLRILEALAGRFGLVLVPVEPFNGVSDAALLDTYTRLMKELGEFSATFHDALADGEITADELERMRVEMRDFERAGEELLNRAAQLVDDD